MINGEKIKELMSEKGVTGVQLAEVAGVSEPMIGYIIRGLRGTTVDVLVRIARHLGVTVDELIRKEGT